MKREEHPMWGKKHRPDTIAKMKAAHKGCKAWNKGIPMSEESKKRISESKKGTTAWNKGKSNYWVVGEKNVNWKGGINTLPERIKERRRDYHQRHKNKPEYLLSINLRKRMLKILGRKKGRDSAIDFLGCSINDLKFYIEGKFKEGMSWDNHGNKGWHIDHVIPLAFYDLSDQEQVKKAFNYSNLQPLWAMENLKKGAKIQQDYAG